MSSLEWMTLHSILDVGVGGLLQASELSVEPKHFDGDASAKSVFDFLLKREIADRLPTPNEIFVSTGVEVPECDEPCDLKLYANELRRQKLRSELFDGLKGVVKKAETDPDEGRAAVHDLFLSTAMARGRSDVRTGSVATIDRVVERYEKAKDRALTGGIVGLSSPWPSWDRHSRGVQRGQIVTLLSKRGGGKTQLSLLWAAHVWQHDLLPGQSIAYVSMEVDRDMLMERLFAIRNRFDYARFTGGTLTGEEERKFYDFCQRLRCSDSSEPEMRFYFSDEIKSVNDVVMRVKETRPTLVIVDGIYLLGRNSKKSRWERVADTVESLKQEVAITCDVPVMITSQLKSSVSAHDKGVNTDMAAYASAVLDTSDVVLGVFNEDQEGLSQTRVMRLIKGREIPLPYMFSIEFDMSAMKFDEIELMGEDDEIEF